MLIAPIPAPIHTAPMPPELTHEPAGARGERTASAMETQLTALERKIDDLLTSVASADAPGSEVDDAGTGSTGHATGTGENPTKTK